jgi:anti-sigma factor RsiW
MSDLKDDLLQRYFDDELAPAERAEVEARLDDEDQERLAALGELRLLLNATLDKEAAQVDLWPGIEQALGGGGDHAARKAAVGAFRRRARIGVVAAIGALAAAAAVVLLLVRTPAPTNVAAVPGGTEIEDLETEGSMVTVVTEDDDDDDGATTILWMTDDEEEL